MDIAYTAKATSDITCIAETDPEQWTSDDPDLHVRVRGEREDGVVVIEGVIKLYISDKPTTVGQSALADSSCAPTSATIDTCSTFFSPTNFRCTKLASTMRARLVMT